METDFTATGIPIIVEINENNERKFIKEKSGKCLSKNDEKRIYKLGIPPAYKKIWLSKDVKSNIQAIALDSKDRKQYYYSSSWIESTTDNKFKRLYSFVLKLPKFHKGVNIYLKNFSSLDQKEYTMANMLYILEKTFIRVGNKKYLDKYDSFGLTTLKKKHIVIQNGKYAFHFIGKHGVKQTIPINDDIIINFINKQLKLPTEWIMKYKSQDGNYYRISAQDLNKMLQKLMGKQFTCKDFRTHGANKTFLETLKKLPIQKNLNKNIVISLEKTAEVLGNNKNTSKKSYVMEYIIKKYNEDPEFIKKTNLKDLLKSQL